MADPLSLLTAGSKVLGSTPIGKSDSIGPALSRATLRDNTFVTGEFGLSGGTSAIGSARGGMPGGQVIQYAVLAGVALVAAVLLTRGSK